MKIAGSQRSGRRRLLAVSVVAMLTVAFSMFGVGGAVGSTPKSAAFTTPPIKHVWLIILENKSFESTFTGLNQNSYLWKILPTYGVLLRQYYGTAHYSQPNYISLVAGQGVTPDVQSDCPTYKNVSPGTPAPDGQVYASSGCVYPASVLTLFNQLDQKHISWKGYMQDMGNNPAREQATCGEPAGGVGPTTVSPGGATPNDQYVPKHNPFVWFHSIINSPECAQNVVPLGTPTSTSGLARDLLKESTTPAFSWITPDNCDDAHDATCKGNDDPTLSDATNDPNTSLATQGGLYASDLFLKTWIPKIMASPAFQDNGLIDITFDEGFPPYQVFGNSFADLPASSVASVLSNGFDPVVQQTISGKTYYGNTAQSVVACCNELPGPNSYEAGDQAFGQDTTPGGGVTGSVLISRYIVPGTISDQPYNHYSWLRSMEDLFGVTKGGTDGKGHLGFAGMDGLRPFGPDVYSDPSGKALPPAASTGANGVFAARGGGTSDTPQLGANGRPVPDSLLRPAGDPLSSIIPPNIQDVAPTPTPSTGP